MKVRSSSAVGEAIRRHVATVVGLVVVASPGFAKACAVCTAGRDEENQLAYILTTIFMSLLPLVAVGTLIFIVWRRYRLLDEALEAGRASGLEAQQRAARDDSHGSHASKAPLSGNPEIATSRARPVPTS